MPLDSIYRTSGFRLTLIFFIVLCFSLSLLFYLTIWSMKLVQTHEIDAAVLSEVNEILNDASGQDLAFLIQTVRHVSTTSPRYFYLLEDAEGRRLAGNMPAFKPILGVGAWQGRSLTLRARVLRVRGLGVRTTDNAYLFVGLSFRTKNVTYSAATQPFLAVMILTCVAVALAGLIMSGRLLKRVEAISQTSREIVLGDLQRRIPVRGTNDEFDHLATSLNTMLDRIQDLMNGLRQVSNDIAHDLRTPLTRLRQRLEHARFNATTAEEMRSTLDQSISHVDSILDVFASMLRISQIESGSRRAGFKTIDIGPILREVADLYAPVIEEKKQILRTEIADDLILSGDCELLKVLFVNVLDNAVKYAPSQAVIKVSGKKNNKQIIAEVADNGPGIAPAFRENVFERFYRLEQSRSTPGYGLGLSLVGAVVSLHDSTIELLDNMPGLRVRVVFNQSTAAV